MTRRSFVIPVFAILALVPCSLVLAGTTASYRYQLSNFSGPVPSQWARLAVDQERNEIYALNQRQNDIRVFDEHGMEIFVFGDGLSTASDIAIGRDGSIFILSTGYQTASVHRFSYRGEHLSEISLKNVPKAFSRLVPDRIVYAHRSLYLVDSDALLVLVVDERGYFEQGHDLNTALRPALTRERVRRKLEAVDWKLEKLKYIELSGFTVDNQGNLLFTVPVLFSAFRLSPDGEMTRFGAAGSGPGKFGVAAGIAIDDSGYVFVADRLRSVVLVFDPEFRFQEEFGYRGDRPSNLLVPDDVAVDRAGNIFVAQAANRGVSVFRVVRDSRHTIEGSEFVQMEENGNDE